jgi:hypothetical protein
MQVIRSAGSREKYRARKSQKCRSDFHQPRGYKTGRYTRAGSHIVNLSLENSGEYSSLLKVF